MQTKTVGDFGEDLVALILQKEYGPRGASILRVGGENLSYDLMVLNPDDTPFVVPSVISVKTRGGWSDVIPPSREQLRREIEAGKAMGFAVWLAFVGYEYRDGGLAFRVFLLPGERLNEDQDFRRVRRGGKDEDQIVTARMMDKAVLRFSSRDGVINLG